MLITSEMLYKFNNIYQEDSEEAEALINVYIGSAQRIITNYVGFDCIDVITEHEDESEDWPEDVQNVFRLTCLRIATLLQQEGNGNIGVNTSGEMGVSRSFLNVVDYTPYLRLLSAFRKDTQV